MIPNQVQPSGAQPYVQQMNFGQMIGEISAYNPNALPQIRTWINDEVRDLYDLKTWYGLFIKGQVPCPPQVSGGTATVTLNSTTIQGTNTTWDTNLVGRQFRIGLNNPIYTITAVDVTNQQLTIELPWAGPMAPGQTTQTSGYNIVQAYYNLGPNIKYIKVMVNIMLGYRMKLNLTQDWLNKKDPWRIWVNFPYGIAPLPADPNGNYMVEMWPAPFTQQALPFMAYIQPPNLVYDTDSLPPFIRTDVIVKKTIGRVLRYKPKDNPGYDPQTALAVARDFDEKYVAALQGMWNADENLYRTSATIEGEDYPEGYPGGDLWAAQHAVMAGDSGLDWW